MGVGVGVGIGEGEGEGEGRIGEGEGEGKRTKLIFERPPIQTPKLSFKITPLPPAKRSEI